VGPSEPRPVSSYILRHAEFLAAFFFGAGLNKQGDENDPATGDGEPSLAERSSQLNKKVPVMTDRERIEEKRKKENIGCGRHPQGAYAHHK
jgi:hypothetical protein